MAQREGSIYLYLFIMAFVLFVGALVLFFMVNADKQQVEHDLALSKQNEVRQQEDQRKLIEDITKLKAMVVGQDAVDSFVSPEFYLQQLKEKIETPINLAREDLQQSKAVYDNLMAPWGDVSNLLQALRSGWSEANVARASAVDVQLAAKEESDKTLEESRAKHQAALQELQDCQSKYEDLDNRFKARETELAQQIQTSEDECADAIIKLKRQINAEENKVRALQIRIDKLEEEVRKTRTIEDVEPDGRIESIIAQSGKAWVDLGRRDRLHNGLVFRVFQDGKGGKKHYKGSVEVQKVGEDTSEVRVVEELNPLDPIVAGDFVSSPFYDKKATPIFVFAGTELETQGITQEFLVQKMTSYGADVRSAVDINTDFLVATKNYENTPEYRAARELNVTVIRERDLLEFIGR